MFLDMSGTGEPHPWSWTALCSKRNKVATPFHSNFVERRRHDAPCAGAHTCAHEPHRTARPARRARAMAVPAAPCPCAPSVPRCFYFWRKTDFACQDLSAAAEKRARWSCRWHPTTAGPMDDCCPLLLAALARAGRAGAHSSVPTPWNADLSSLHWFAPGENRFFRCERLVGKGFCGYQ